MINTTFALIVIHSVYDVKQIVVRIGAGAVEILKSPRSPVRREGTREKIIFQTGE